MPRLNRIGFLFLLGLLFAGLSVTAAPGRYIEVAVEAFEDWGFLGWGSWTSVDETLIRLSISNLAEEDREAIDQAIALCDGGTAACDLLEQVDYGFERLFGIVPELGASYRVRLTNRTDATVGVVLAIDGLNTNGGAEVLGTAADKKWVLLPQQTVAVSGWQVSEREALQFRFETPSHSVARDAAARGEIAVYTYLPTSGRDGERGTAAGEVIDQPTVRIPFAAVTDAPIEVIRIRYNRDRVALGILCEDMDGTGIRIHQVVEGTIAELRGLRAGDIVTVANGLPIRRCADLQAILAARQPGDRIVLQIHRNEGAFLLTLELEE